MSHFPPHSPCPLSYLPLISLIVLFLLARLPNILIVLSPSILLIVFQDNLTKMTIGIGKEMGDLYYLKGVRQLQFESNRVFQVAREAFDREKIIFYIID